MFKNKFLIQVLEIRNATCNFSHVQELFFGFLFKNKFLNKVLEMVVLELPFSVLEHVQQYVQEQTVSS